MAEKGTTTVKMWPRTLKRLRILAAWRGKRMVRVLDDLVEQAFEVANPPEPPPDPTPDIPDTPAAPEPDPEAWRPRL